MNTQTSVEPTSSPSSQDGDLPLLAYFGHHKCASGWTTNIFREICFYMGRTFRVVHRPVDFEANGSLGAHVRAQEVDFLAHTNANRDHVLDLPPYRGFHVVRDPRDILVSAYFSHRYSHGTSTWPELAAHRERLQALSKEDGLFAEMEFNASFFEDMATWDYEQEHVLELHMEDLTADPDEGFLEIAAFLGILAPREPASLSHTVLARMNRLNRRGRDYMPRNLPLFPVPHQRLQTIPGSTIGRIIDRFRFSKLAGGRKRGQENKNSHYRKGQPGDWKNHFTDAHVRTFKDRYNNLLLKLDYESDPDW